MVLKIYQIILYFIISKTIKSLPKCPKIFCDLPKNKGEKCLLYNEVENLIKINISLCIGDNTYCPVQSDTFENATLTCKEKPIKNLQLYPGMYCIYDDECSTKECINNECKGQKINETCEHDIDCVIGLTCINNQCEKLREIGKSCTKDTDCVLNAGCHNYTCTKYFTLPDGESVEQDTYFNDGLSFCRGGTAIDKKCYTLNLYNPKEPCDDKTNPCIYYYYKDNKKNNITIKDNCLCGYNLDGLRYCKLGGKDLNYTRFIRYKMDYLKEKRNYCHTIEHGLNNVCRIDVRDEYYLSYLNYELWALFNYQMYNAPDCVLKNVFPDYNKELDTKEISNETCGKYTCQSIKDDSKKCLNKIVKNTEINITLLYNNSVNSPNKQYKCSVNKNNLYHLNNEMVDYEKEEDNNKYDGDYCETECFNKKENMKLKCENNTCKLSKEDNSCIDHFNCSVGQFCNNGECKKQLTKGNKCSEDYECENHLICFNFTCSDVLLKKKIGEVSNNPITCYYNLINNGICIKKKRKLNFNKSFEDFIRCDNNNDCTYSKIKSENKTNNTEIGKDLCECGYRKDKRKYCPLIPDDFPELWDKYVKLFRALSKNKCHTVKRYSCSKLKIENKSLYDEFISLKILFEKGHYFYKSDDCVEYFLHGNYFYLNKMILILIYLFIIC